MSNKNHAVTQSEQNNSFLALGGRGVGTLVEPVKNEPCETACRMAEGVKRSEKAQNVHPLWEDRNL